MIGGLTLVSRILGFLRDMVIARCFGADWATDAFFVAFKVPNLLRRLFAEGAFSQAFVPLLAEYRERYGSATTRAFLGRTAGALALTLGSLTGIGMLAAPLLILLFAPGFYAHPERYGLSVELLRIVFPYLFFIGLTAFAGSILNTWRHFAVPALTPALLNLSMIAAALWLAPQLAQPVTALAFGVLLAGLVQLALQIPALRRIGCLTRPRLGFSDPGVQRILKLMAPAIFGVSVAQLNLLLNTLLASFLVSGSVSWLYYADRLVEFPLGIFGAAIGTVILPHLSKHHASRDPEAFSRALDWALRWLALIGVPATLGLILLARPVVFTLFQYRQFSAHDAEMAAGSLTAYAVGLLGFLAVKVLVPGFSARQDLGTPARYGVYAVAANLGLSLLLVWQTAPRGWGHAGLALATALAATVNAALLLGKLLRDRVYRPAPGWPGFLSRLLLANGAMAAVLVQGTGIELWATWSLAERAVNLGLWLSAGLACYLLCLSVTGLRPRHLLLSETP
ncbi:putative lipid II flippase MurJ [Candidatus Methylocalor cossyra]|uniref:Probable lipid II flippase MurJ n=1 Tax=Candidatus Methylocalor cossyra TaxID=3108543 RepID=A0ABM9NMA4_9GAMM